MLAAQTLHQVVTHSDGTFTDVPGAVNTIGLYLVTQDRCFLQLPDEGCRATVVQIVVEHQFLQRGFDIGRIPHQETSGAQSG